MYSIEKATEEFEAVYLKGIRSEYDIGQLHFKYDDKIVNYENQFDYFIKRLRPVSKIHISQPFNLVLIPNQADNRYKVGWETLKNNDQLHFFGNQNGDFLLIDTSDNNIYCLYQGDIGKNYLAENFSDIIRLISEVMLISNKYLIAHDMDEDYMPLEDENLITEIFKAIDKTELNVSKSEFRNFFFE